MKNEVKLNIHMFFPEQLHDEISAEKHAALEKLINLPPNDAEDSIEKFIAELKSRLALIKPILRGKTEEFLGYCQSDITKLSDFFAGRFARFGMDAVAVQKILRKIWQQTPCEDKRLNYDLYKFIDEKFYGIVNERKRTISFEHIPAPEDGSWETLENDWKVRRAHYAKELEIDMDYLDGEAVDGRIFPSASGLFAQPVLLHGHEIEFLNFWMPHLLNYKNESTNEDELTIVPSSYILVKDVRMSFVNGSMSSPYSRYVEIFKSLLEINIPDAGLHDEYFEDKLYLSDYEIYEERISELYRDNDFNHSAQEITNDNYADVLNEVESIWFNKAIECFKKIQPSHFFMLGVEWYTKSRYYMPLGKKHKAIKNPDELQLPEFENSCYEYVLVNKQISKSKHLIFYAGQKIYIPDNFSCFDKWIEYAEAFKVAHIAIPNYSDVQKIDEYYKQVYPLMVGYRYGGEAYNWTKDEILKYPNIFHFRLMQFIQCIAKLFDHYAQDENLSGIYKIQMLVTIKNNFADICEICPDLKKHMTEVIEGLRKSEPSDLEIDNFADNINNIYYLCEKEKLKLQAKEAEIRVAERDSIITTICHNINGTIGSIKVNLDSNVKRVPNDIRSSLERALSGAKMIGNMVDQILRSYKYTKEQFFDDIDNPDNSSYRFEDMLYENLDIVVENTFSDDFLYEQKYLFSDETEMQRLQEEFYNSPQDDILDFINKNFTNIKIAIPENILNKMIGNKNGTATNIYVILNEFMKNAFRALAYVPLDKRAFSIEAYDNDEQIIFEMKNTCSSEDKTDTRSKGFGGLITSNIIKAFGELKKMISSDGQQFSLKVIIQKRQGKV